MSQEPIIFRSVSVYNSFSQSEIGYKLRFRRSSHSGPALDLLPLLCCYVSYVIGNESERSKTQLAEHKKGNNNNFWDHRWKISKCWEVPKNFQFGIHSVVTSAVNLGVGSPDENSGLEKNRFFSHIFTIAVCIECSRMWSPKENYLELFHGDFSSGVLRRIQSTVIVHIQACHLAATLTNQKRPCV